jgi:Fic family protein
VQPQLEKLLDWTASSEFREFHPLLQAARVQHEFIKIFPFTDTSGKVGRMLTNYLLMRNHFLPVVIVSVDRSKYYETFRASFTTFSNLMMDSMENSLDNGLKYFKDLQRFYR